MGSTSSVPDGFVDSVSLLMKQPSTWQDCVAIARIKFEKYFKHMALALLSAFPLDTVVSNGSKSWLYNYSVSNPFDKKKYSTEASI